MLLVTDETVKGRIKWVDVRNVRMFGHFTSGKEIGGIDQKTAQILTDQVHRSSHSGAEGGSCLSVGRFVGM